MKLWGPQEGFALGFVSYLARPCSLVVADCCFFHFLYRLGTETPIWGQTQMKMESFTFCRTVLIFFMFPCVQVMKAVCTECSTFILLLYSHDSFLLFPPTSRSCRSPPSLVHKNMEPIRATQSGFRRAVHTASDVSSAA